ncbi:MAG: YegP family protein [Bacteroidota bacterium]
MAKFEIYKSKGGKFHFRLKSSNGQTTLTSQGYAAKPSAKNGIESAKKNMNRDGGTELFEGKGGKHYFRIKSTNGQTVASSQGYASARGAVNGLSAVQKSAGDAEVVDTTV